MNENERIDDLEINGLRLIQDRTKYCFTSDSVLLANSVKVLKDDKILEIGTGTGIIAVLLGGKKNAQNVTALEIQQDMSNIAERNVKMNNIDDKVTVVNDSLQHFSSITPTESYDTIVTNPPYKKLNSGDIDNNECRKISKYEVKLNLEELATLSSKLLKFRGKFYMVHRADRMAECIYYLKLNKLEPKVITLVYPKKDKAPDTVIYECLKGGQSGVKIKSLVVYEQDGSLTPEAKKLYSKD